MILNGLPDFMRIINMGDYTYYYPYNGWGNIIVKPAGFNIGETQDGKLDFHLTEFRMESAPEIIGGRLNFSIVPSYHMDKALTDLRRIDPNAVLDFMKFASGYLRFEGDEMALPPEFKTQVPLAWDGFGSAMYSVDMTVGSCQLLKKCLENATLNFIAYADMELEGVSPRLPLAIKFNSQELLKHLWNLSNDKGVVRYDSILEYFKKDLSILPLTVTGSMTKDQEEFFAPALTDRIRMRFGTFVSVRNGGNFAYIKLAPPGDSGAFTWNLSESIPVLRPFPSSLQVDPFEAARRLVKEGGIDAITRKVTVPPLSAGYKAITIVTALPDQIPDNLQLGVNITVPPRPPDRPRAQGKTIEIPPGKATIIEKFYFSSACDEVEFNYQTYAVIFQKGVKTYKGEEIIFKEPVLYINHKEFPVGIMIVTGEKQFLDIAIFKGTIKMNGEEPYTFELSAKNKMIILPLIGDRSNGYLEGEAISIEDGSKKIYLSQVPIKRFIGIGCYSFREYGYHKVNVTYTNIDKGGSPVLFEFQGEGNEDIGILTFDSKKSNDEIRWNTNSMFKPRYRYRQVSKDNKKKPGPVWSDYLSPFEPLLIDANKKGKKG